MSMNEMSYIEGTLIYLHDDGRQTECGVRGKTTDLLAGALTVMKQILGDGRQNDFMAAVNLAAFCDTLTQDLVDIRGDQFKELVDELANRGAWFLNTDDDEVFGDDDESE